MTAKDGIELGVTEHSYVTLLCQKGDDAVSFAITPERASELDSEIQSHSDRAKNQLERGLDPAAKNMASDGETLADANRRGLNYLRERVEDLEAENERLRERLADLENVVATDVNALNYADMGKREKVRKVHQYLIDQAESRPNGRAAMDYTNVRSLFDGHASPGHAYELMELAADAPGFEYEERDGANNRLTVNTQAVKDAAAFRTANKAHD